MPLYQDIKVGESYFDPEGFKVVVTGTHDTTCGERWLTYIRNPGTNLESNCSVPYGYFNFCLYYTLPSKLDGEQFIEARKANLVYQRSKSNECAKYN